LNCLLLHMEWTLSQYYMGLDDERSREYEMAATRRRFAIHRLLWNHERAFFFDFNIVTNKQMDIW
jgi:neutral trehalase